MKLPKLEVLTKEEVKTIHSASLLLLSTIGIKIDSKEVRDRVKQIGAETDDNSTFVRFSEALIKEQLRKIPNSFKLHGPDGTFNFEVDTTSTKFATIGTPVKIYDPTKKNSVRKTVMADTINQIRVVDSLEHILCSHVDVWPHDINYTALHAHCIYQWAKNTRKPYGLGCFGRLPSQDMMDMISIIVGGKKELIQRPRLVGFFNPTSPLRLPQILTNGYEVFAKYKQPTIVAPEALAGISAPVTLAGLLAQTNAEVIGAAIIGQMFNPGSPIFFGTVSTIGDMRTGNSALGSIETGIITAGMAQLARFYDIPSRGPGGITDSKCLDVQNGFERLQTLLFAAQAGINYITCAGTYEETLVEALELLLVDDELAGVVNRALEGITVNEDTIALDVIKNVVTSEKKGVNYLSEKHTRKYMHEELYIPKLINRDRRSTWRKKGSLDIIETAGNKVKQILQSFNPPKLDNTIEQKLLNYIKDVEKRTLDDYRIAEGISGGNISLPGTDIKIGDN
ncbi:MAG: trimethylamine methyltransferase family protein [Promethearchaeota archaeon]|jgi:trimethylamine--corrinoid protein Co-methyltransferase